MQGKGAVAAPSAEAVRAALRSLFPCDYEGWDRTARAEWGDDQRQALTAAYAIDLPRLLAEARAEGRAEALRDEALLDVLKHPEKYLSAEEVAEYKRCQQSVIDARRSAERNEGQQWVG